MSDYTKGPWRYQHGGIWSGKLYPIAQIADVQESENNARLISAAPELLEALQNIMGLYDTPIERRKRQNDSFYSDSINFARKAISKAEGK